MSRGGRRTPANPAPVSGPGALARRTDGGPAQAIRDLPNARYGENAEFRTDESGAPMASAPSSSPSLPAGAPTSPAGTDFQHPMGEPPPPLTGGTMNPDEPVTAGVPFGPGPNSMMLPTPNEALTARSVLQAAAQAGGSQAQALLARLQNGL